MEKNSCFGTRIIQKLNEWMKDKNRKKNLRLMQTALTSLWCCAGWKFPSKLRIFSLPHHPPVGVHPSQGDKQNLFPAGTASYLCIHQVQSRSDWAAVRRSRWRIHRATIERFISVYRLEANGSLLKEGTVDAVGWALRACSYKTKTEASQQRRSRHTLQGVFLVFLFLFSSFPLFLFVSSSLRLFVSSSLCLFLPSSCLYDDFTLFLQLVRMRTRILTESVADMHSFVSGCHLREFPLT